MIRQLAPGMVQQMQSVCSDCNGEGKCTSVFIAFIIEYVGNIEVGNVYNFTKYAYIHFILKMISNRRLAIIIPLLFEHSVPNLG